jgi:hypothetical protein
MSSESLYFSFEEYANSLAELIREQNREKSFVIAITGTWGCGKTTLMDITLDKLNDGTFIKVIFNAWRYTKEDAVWRGFFIAIISALRQHISSGEVRDKIGWGKKDYDLCEKLIDETERSLYTAFTRESPGEVSIDASNLAKSGLKLALKFIPWGEFGSDWVERIFQKKDKKGKPSTDTFDEKDIDNLWGVFKRSVVKRQIEKLSSMEQFRFSMEQLLRAVMCGDYEEPITKEKLKHIPSPFQLVVAIDDLDRCLPEQALEIFEAIKLFIDLPRTNFLVALDQDIIQHALNLRYKQEKLKRPQIRAEQYTEKMIALSFSVPSVLESNFLKYIENELPNGKQLTPIYQTLKIALPINLRTWERFATKADFNRKILERICNKEKGDSSSTFRNADVENMYLKLQCLAYQWPEVFRKIGNLNTYSELERCSLECSLTKYQDNADEDLATFMISSSSNAEKVSNSVWKVIKDVNLIQFLRSKPLMKDIGNKNNLEIIFSLDQKD